MSISSSARPESAMVFMTARDCELYVSQSIQSLSRQTHDDLQVLFVDDASSDDTGQIAQSLLRDLFPGRHTFVRNDEQWGKARNVWEHLRPRTSEAAFVAVLDGDDQLVEPEILRRMAALYRDGRDVVWTNYVTDRRSVGGNGSLDPGRPPREQGWKTSHFFSFRAKLLDGIPEHYFQDSLGKWLPAACDMALAVPVLDQTRRYEFLPVKAYRYTATNPWSHHNQDPQAQGLNSRRQRECAREVYAKTPLPRVDIDVSKTGHPIDPGLALESAVQKIVSLPSGSEPAANRAGSAWEQVAAADVARTCPALLDAIALSGCAQPSPLRIRALQRALVMLGKQARILHVGSRGSALTLAALADAENLSLTCLCQDEPGAADLIARLSLQGSAAHARVINAGRVELAFENFSGAFANPDALDAGESFGLVVIDAGDGALNEGSALVSLPVLAARLSMDGFIFCLLAPDDRVQRLAADHWARACGGLLFCRDAAGPGGLFVIGSN